MKIEMTHPLIETRLIWMRDNQPNLLMQKFKDGTLKENVYRTVREATESYQLLLQKGVDKLVAEELRLNEVAPAEGMDADRKVRQISDKMFELILSEVM